MAGAAKFLALLKSLITRQDFNRIIVAMMVEFAVQRYPKMALF
jgi:hypothetical protein